MINPFEYNTDNNQSIDLLQGNDNQNQIQLDRPTQFKTQNLDVKKYINLIENELTKMGYSFSDMKYVSEIIIILNKLSYPNSFNKTLFSHILSTANFDPDKPINLLDFFNSYLVIYTSMKECRDNIIVEILDTNNQIEKIKNQISEIKDYEIEKSDGITSNSSLQIIFKNNKEKIQTGSFNKIQYAHIDFGIEKPLNFYFNESITKREIKIDNMRVLDFPIKVYIKTEMEDKLIDTLNAKDLLETVVNRDYEFFQFSFLFINSMVSFMKKKIKIFTRDVGILQNDVTVLNTSINYLEVIFKNYFQQVPRSQYSNYVSKYLGNEMEISEKIEGVILKVIGRPLISKWNKIAFILNKVLFITSIIQAISKADFLTFTFVFILFSIEYDIIGKRFLYNLLVYLCSIFGFDILYLFRELNVFNKETAYQLPKVGKIYREICFALYIFNLVIKIALLFSLWKMALEYKLYQVNMEQIQRRRETKIENDFIKKNYRRNINYNKIKNSVNNDIKEFGKDFLI